MSKLEDACLDLAGERLGEWDYDILLDYAVNLTASHYLANLHTFKEDWEETFGKSYMEA